MKRLTIFMGVICVIGGCSTASQSPDGAASRAAIEVNYESDFNLAAGQTARVNGTPISVIFRSVSQDSRCPSDVQCVWAGDGEIKIGLQSTSAASQEATLHTNLEPRFVDYGGYRLRIVALAPYPKSGSRISPEKYVVTLNVSSP